MARNINYKTYEWEVEMGPFYSIRTVSKNSIRSETRFRFQRLQVKIILVNRIAYKEEMHDRLGIYEI